MKKFLLGVAVSALMSWFGFGREYRRLHGAVR